MLLTNKSHDNLTVLKNRFFHCTTYTKNIIMHLCNITRMLKLIINCNYDELILYKINSNEITEFNYFQ